MSGRSNFTGPDEMSDGVVGSRWLSTSLGMMHCSKLVRYTDLCPCAVEELGLPYVFPVTFALLEGYTVVQVAKSGVSYTSWDTILCYIFTSSAAKKLCVYISVQLF